jgi:hypothetical protein
MRFIGPLPTSGYPLLSRIVVSITQQRAVYQESVSLGTCLLSRCPATGLRITLCTEWYCISFEQESSNALSWSVGCHQTRVSSIRLFNNN